MEASSEKREIETAMEGSSEKRETAMEGSSKKERNRNRKGGQKKRNRNCKGWFFQKKRKRNRNFEKKNTKEGDTSMNHVENLGQLTCKFVDAWGDCVYAQKLIYDFSQSGLDVHIVSGHENVAIPMITSFRGLIAAQQEKLGCLPNMKFAFLPLSKSDVTRFLSDGVFPITCDAVCLFPAESPLESLQSATPDEDGLCHLVVCQVIMGRMELVHPDSGQCHLNSEEYDSGVDNLSCPKKLFVPKCYAHTHILPSYVFSLKTSPKVNGRVPVPFPLIYDDIRNLLPLDSYVKVADVDSEFAEGKIDFDEFERRIREIAGNNLIEAVEDSFNEKEVAKAWGFDDIRSYFFEKEASKHRYASMSPSERAYYKKHWPNSGWPFFDTRKIGLLYSEQPIEEWPVQEVSSSDWLFSSEVASNQFGTCF